MAKRPYIRPQFAAMAAVAESYGLARLARHLRLFGRVNVANLNPERPRRFMGAGYATRHAELTGRAMSEAAAISEAARVEMARAFAGMA